MQLGVRCASAPKRDMYAAARVAGMVLRFCKCKEAREAIGPPFCHPPVSEGKHGSSIPATLRRLAQVRASESPIGVASTRLQRTFARDLLCQLPSRSADSCDAPPVRVWNWTPQQQGPNFFRDVHGGGGGRRGAGSFSDRLALVAQHPGCSSLGLRAGDEQNSTELLNRAIFLG